MPHTSRTYALLGSACAVIALAGHVHAASPASPQLLLQGRFSPGPGLDGFGTLPQTMSWSASQITFQVATSPEASTPSSLTFNFTDVPTQYDKLSVTNFADEAATLIEILVNGELARSCAVGPSGAQCIVSGLAPGSNYTVTVAKLAEPLGGEATLETIIPSPSISFTPVALPPTVTSGRRIQFIGDSFTAGLGVMGNASCGPIEAITVLENSYLTFANLLGSYFVADYQVIAWSAAGAVAANTINLQQGFGRRLQQAVTMPSDLELFGRAVAGDPASKANFSSWVPQVVVVAGGVNDFAKGNDVEAWVETYTAFVQNVSAVYNDPDIILVSLPDVPALDGSPGTINQGQPAAGESNAQYQSDMSRVFTALELQEVPNLHFLALDVASIPTEDIANWCEGHPNAAAHEVFAEQLHAFITADLKHWWSNDFPPSVMETQ